MSLNPLRTSASLLFTVVSTCSTLAERPPMLLTMELALTPAVQTSDVWSRACWLSEVVSRRSSRAMGSVVKTQLRDSFSGPDDTSERLPSAAVQSRCGQQYTNCILDTDIWLTLSFLGC